MMPDRDIFLAKPDFSKSGCSKLTNAMEFLVRDRAAALLPADAVVRRNPADKRRQSLLSRIQVLDGDGAYVLD